MLRSIFILAVAIALAIILINVFFKVLGALFQLAWFLLLLVLAYWLFLRIREAVKKD